MVRLLTVCWKVRASPWRLPRIVGGTISLAAFSMNSVASPIGTPGFRLK